MAALTWCLVLFAGPAQARPSAEVFGELPFVSTVRLSPDGKHIAMLQPMQGRMVAVIFQTHPEAGAKPVYISGGDLILADLQWVSNSRLVLIAKESITAPYDDRLRTWARAVAVDINGGNGVLLLKNMPTAGVNTNTTEIVDTDLDDPDHIYMDMYDFITPMQEDFNTRLGIKNDKDFFRDDLIKVDVHSGEGEIFQTGKPETVAWFSDGHGHPVARIDQTEAPLKDHLIVLHGGAWNEVGTFDATADNGIRLAGMTEDGKNLVLLQRNDRSFMGLLERSLSDNTEKSLYYVDNYDIDDAIVDEWTGRVVGAEYITDKEEDHYFDPKRQGLQMGLENAFPGLTVHIVSWDAAGDTVIFSVEGPREPKTYYLLDRATHMTQTIASTRPTLQQSELGEMRAYNYTARDGLPISAYLTLPPGKPPKNLPVVIMPHGGPDARDYLRFDWMAQFLASRGYAVLQPNFRGSWGFGDNFTKAGLHQWGLKIQDDVTDGVKKLIADGTADPKRICIFGASFGGYVALAGAAFTPNLYACAASWAGVSDLPAAMQAERRDYGGKSQIVSFWGSRIGNDDIPQLNATSPDHNAAAIKCPVLLMHGDGDTTVRIEQSEMMNEALEKAHKKVEFIRFPGEDHYMNIAATRIGVLEALEKFLSENIGN
ncbi:MAG: S9 family peptidase [Alphaproteobacteria bacterium]|nr:S9 family peptidase [Alphaproteobacteria bacterium]MDE2493143.1 S9 family peptidase [Alphaproteobacteria bacterium]